MTFPKARLVVSALLFVSWIGFLAFLVARTRDPVILSRPQFLVSHLHVLAKVQEKEGRPDPLISVEKVLWSADAADQKLAGTTATLVGLEDCGARQGWRGAGTYLIALSRDKGSLVVTPIPRSPGYEPQYASVELLSAGEDREAVASLVQRFTGWDAATSKGFAKGVLRRNVPLAEADSFKRLVQDAKGNVRLREEETRLHPATADALEQYAELVRR